MRNGVDGGMITQSEYLIAKLASDHRIPKRVSNSFIETVKRDDFNPDDLRFDTIQPIEQLISKAHDGGTIQEFNFGKEEDGEQELVLIIRLLRQIIEDLLADPRFKGCQFLSFEIQERNGVRIFGAANGGVWWQINSLLVGPENVLIGIIIFTDGSWIKKGITCEALYGAVNIRIRALLLIGTYLLCI